MKKYILKVKEYAKLQWAYSFYRVSDCLINAKRKVEERCLFFVSSFRKNLFYQRFKRCDSGKKSLSDGFTPNASYQA